MAAHPGEILRTEFIEPMGVTAYQLAKSLHFPGIYEILREDRAISADVALRRGKYFGMTPRFWMNLQTAYDLRLARASAPLAKIKPRSAASRPFVSELPAEGAGLSHYSGANQLRKTRPSRRTRKPATSR